MIFDDSCFGGPMLTLAIKLFLAALAGALIGFEREKHGRPAGLRTHLLVALASCLMMIISEAFYLKYGQNSGLGVLRVDPSRVAAQIVAGIGFIGAGVIIKEGLTVRGLTTAACLWMAAAVGMGFGMGLYVPTVIGTAIGLAALIGLKQLEPYIKKDRYLTFIVVAGSERDIYPELERIFAAAGSQISDVSCEFDTRQAEARYEFVLTQHRKRIGRDLSVEVAKIAEVRKIAFR